MKLILGREKLIVNRHFFILVKKTFLHLSLCVCASMKNFINVLSRCVCSMFFNESPSVYDMRCVRDIRWISWKERNLRIFFSTRGKGEISFPNYIENIETVSHTQISLIQVSRVQYISKRDHC